MLEVNGLHAGYGSSRILNGISFTVKSGEVVSLIGRNGAGKSTTLKSIIGLVSPAQGSIKFKSREISGLKPFRIARLGLGYVPEDRRIYAGLTIKENLEIATYKGEAGKKWTEGKIYELFPQLKQIDPKRLGGNMSGGEQQMLSIARTLMGDPEFLLLDEPSEGLAPLVVSMLAGVINEIKGQGLSILLSEQNMRFAAKTTDRAYVIDGGRLYFEGTMNELQENEEVIKKHITL